MKTKIQNQFSATDLLNNLPEIFTSLTKDKQELSLSIYRNLEKGKPVSLEDLISTTTLSEEMISDTLNEWPGLYYNENQEIIGYWGLAIQKMPHMMEFSDKTLYGWCAWDSLFIPELLRKNATIRSTDYFTKEEIVIKIDRNGNLLSGSDEIYISMLSVDEEDIRDDVVTTFCHFIYFFKSKSFGEAWVSKHKGTFLISLKEAVELSQTKNRLQYKDFIK
jgi:alkylmercury lyase